MGYLGNAYGAAVKGTGPSGLVYGPIPATLEKVDPAQCFGFYRNFIADGPTSADAGTTLPGWIATAIAHAGVIIPADALTGGIIMTPAAADNDGMQIQSSPAFTPMAGSQIRFGARIAFTDNTQLDAVIGICTLDTDIAGSTPNDVIGFTTVDGDDNINYIVSKDGAGSAVDTGEDLVDATAVILEVVVKGTTLVEFYIDGVLVDTVTSGVPDDEVMGFAISHINGTTVANSSTVTWCYCYQFDYAGNE